MPDSGRPIFKLRLNMSQTLSLSSANKVLGTCFKSFEVKDDAESDAS